MSKVQLKEISDDEHLYYINSSLPVSYEQFSIKKTVRQLAVFLFFWSIPFAAMYFFLDDHRFWVRLILFFTQTAFFTIGGSYTVLPYVAQFAVTKFNWLSKLQMVDGFALAETTPGPLIIVVGFVGFMGGYSHFHSSLSMGTIALVLTIFYTFLPCFLFIFVGGPLIERTHGNDTIADILKLITAAIVGVILNLTFFLGKEVIFPGGVSIAHLNVISLASVAICLFLLLKFKINVVYLIVLNW